jgi:sigma-B regulation protein RsbU (phosphoserine phosphatase)
MCNPAASGMLSRVSTNPSRPTRGPLTSETRAGLGAVFALLALVIVVELADGSQPHFIGLLSAAPFLAALVAPWRVVLVVGGLATVTGLVFGVMPDGLTTASSINIAGVVIAGGIAVLVSSTRTRQATQLAELSKLANVAQAAVLRPLGQTVGPHAIAARYISASAAADIGGDLYEVLDTPYGVRMIIGDVRGKGLDAVRLASAVLGSYRHVVYDRADLRTITADLDRAVSRSVGDEDFVTAALAEERGGTLTIVNCGHPAPMLLRRGKVITLDPPASAPPLGFTPVVRARVERLEPGDRLLLYTDGLAEARRNGEFFPIAARAWGLLGHGTVQDGLASLESALKEWVDGPLDDDIALVLMEYGGGQGGLAEGAGDWELDQPAGR